MLTRNLVFMLLVTLLGCNGTSGENGDDPFSDNTQSVPQSELFRLGHVNAEGEFIAGEIGVSITPDASGTVSISAGGTLGLKVAVADSSDQLIDTQVQISFSSECAAFGAVSLPQSVQTVSGVASASYEDISCAGTNGSSDVITASLQTEEQNISIDLTVEIAAEALGSIVFVELEPEQIVLQGIGGLNNQSTATLTFEVRGERGNPLAQQQVSFSSSSDAGGLELTPVSAGTNSQGRVSTRVIAGTVPVVMRVTAAVEGGDGTILQTQSDRLTINTGLADQDSFSIAAQVFNPEALNFVGETSQISVRLADQFNNPVPDGTVVNFTSEGGQIEADCLTTSGACSVTWISSNPRPADGRITILATASGHETLLDANSNNSFDDSDGGPLNDCLDHGFNHISSAQNCTADIAATGFIDMSEAWRDDNENGLWDPGEPFIDQNNNGQRDAANGLFNGPNCLSESQCDTEFNTVVLRKALVLVMSGSDALLDIFSGEDQSLLFSNHQAATQPGLSVARGEVAEFVLGFTDINGNVLPAGTSITVSSSAGSLSGTTSFTVANTSSGTQSREISFSLQNSLAEGDNATTAELQIQASSPSGITSELIFEVQLN